MEFFYYKNSLFVGQPTHSEAGPPASSVNLAEWSRTQKTPFYLYDLEQIKKRVQFFKHSLSFIKSQNIHFAVKANHNEKILKLLSHEGLGADTVSIGEIKRALSSGFSAQNIIFSGVAKTKTELEQAIDLRIKQINIESYSELQRIVKICQKRNTSIDIGIRLNPRVSANTHKSISTGGADNKFGVDLSDYLPREMFDTPFDYEAFAKRDGLIGHGGIVVFDDSVDMSKQARFAMEFCAIESCGKCTPCRIGSTRGVETIDKIRAGDRVAENIAVLEDLSNTMKFGSLCALGGFTPYPVMSALKYFREDFGPTPARLQAAE